MAKLGEFYRPQAQPPGSSREFRLSPPGKAGFRIFSSHAGRLPPLLDQLQ